MLDALKFAFELLIVGALALPWVAILYRVFSDDRSIDSKFDLSFVPESARSAVSVALVLAVGYLIGSAVSRFSRDFFNDELWQPLPTENMIRDSVYHDELCSDHWTVETLSKGIHLQPPENFCDSLTLEFDQKVQELFLLEESELLLQGVEKIDRLKQYFDQITVLRGAAFNGFVLFSLALFGIFGELKKSWSQHKILQPLAFLPPVLAAIFVVQNVWRHDRHMQSLYSDPPLAELVILLLAAVGFFMILKPPSTMQYSRICIIAMVMMVVSFGGWWWTEVMYDLQVIHSHSEVYFKEEKSPLVEQQLIMKRQSPPQNEPAPSAPHSSTPSPNQKP
jgi:hypothetical protein